MAKEANVSEVAILGVGDGQPYGFANVKMQLHVPFLFQRLVPYTDKVITAMAMLQGRGLGQIFTLKQGNSKVFFKAPPSRSLEVPLNTLGIRITDYEVQGT